jgi:2'-5' RNA ligase
MLWELFQENEEFNELIRRTDKKVGKLIAIPDFRKSHAPLPHITLARFAPTEITDSLPDMHDTIRVGKIVLFESILQGTGSEYRVLADIHLQ